MGWETIQKIKETFENNKISKFQKQKKVSKGV